ncbi:MAG: hypothetical protein AAFX93_03375 [Verrucomicrobiota bacterium]
MSDADQKLIDFMRSEIARTRKGVSQTYLLGIIVAVLVAGYMTFILSMVRQATDGQFLASAVRMQVEAAVPEMIDSGEQALAQKATGMAETMSRRFMEGVPKLVNQGKAQIDETHEVIIPYLSNEFSEVVRLYVLSNQEELTAFADQHNSQEFATEFTDQMMTEFAVQIDARMSDATDGEGLAYFNENLLTSLVAMDTKLDELVSKPVDELTQRERLQRRILARLVSSVTSHENAQ